MATTKIRSSSIEDGQVSNADLSATIAVTGGQIADDAITTAKILDNNVTLDKMAGGTDGNLITYDASGDPAYVATGAATNILTSNGAGAAPTFQAAAAGGGKVLKVYQAAKTDTTSIASTTFADITGLTLTTDAPASTGSRFVVFWTLSISIPSSQETYTRLERTPSGGSDVYPFIGDAAGSRPRTATGGGGDDLYTMYNFSGTYLDSPASSVALTYTMQWRQSGLLTSYLNRTINDRDTADYEPRGASSLVVMEIGS